MVQVPVLLLALLVCACVSSAVGLGLLVEGGRAEVEIAQMGWGCTSTSFHVQTLQSCSEIHRWAAVWDPP